MAALSTAEDVRDLLVATAARIADKTARGQVAESGVRELNELRRAVMAARRLASEDDAAEDILNAAEPKRPVLELLLEIYNSRPPHKRQVEAVLGALVLLRAWRDALEGDQELLRRVPRDLSELYGLTSSAQQDGEAMNSENDTPCFGGAPERGAAAGVLTVSEGGDRLSMTRDRTPTMAGACAAALAEDSWVSRPPPVPDVAPGGEVALRADGQICTADAAPVPEFGGPASSLNGAGPGAASAAASFTASLPALAPTGDRHAGSLAAGQQQQQQQGPPTPGFGPPVSPPPQGAPAPLAAGAYGQPAPPAAAHGFAQPVLSQQLPMQNVAQAPPGPAPPCCSLPPGQPHPQAWPPPQAGAPAPGCPQPPGAAPWGPRGAPTGHAQQPGPAQYGQLAVPGQVYYGPVHTGSIGEDAGRLHPLPPGYYYPSDGHQQPRDDEACCVAS